MVQMSFRSVLFRWYTLNDSANFTFSLHVYLVSCLRDNYDVDVRQPTFINKLVLKCGFHMLSQWVEHYTSHIYCN